MKRLVKKNEELLDNEVPKTDNGENKINDVEQNKVEENLVAGNDVKFIGFGSWETKTRNARELRNPQTGKKMKVAAKRVVKFKAGKALADKVAAKK